jgi:Cellulose binding domain
VRIEVNDPTGKVRNGDGWLGRRLQLMGRSVPMRTLLVVAGCLAAALVTATGAIALAQPLHLRGGEAARGASRAPAPPPSTSSSAGTGCSASLTVTSSWASGFRASVTVRNNGATAINDWTVSWSFPGDQTVTQLWNGHYTQVKSTVTVKSLDWNASPDPNGSTTFGFLGTGAAPETVDELKCTTP